MSWWPFGSKKPVTYPGDTSEQLASDLINPHTILSLVKGTLESCIREMMPTTLQKQIQMALHFANGGSEQISAIVRTKKIFYSAGFNVSISPQNENNKEAWNKRLKNAMRRLQISRVVQDLMGDHSACDSCIIQWKVQNGAISYVHALNPGTIRYQVGIVSDKLEVELSDEMIAQIKALDQNKASAKPVPDKFKKAVDAGQRFVELKNSDGEYWLICTTERKYAGLAKPSMTAIYRDIFLREMLVGGDWAIAFFLKRVIEHVKHGEKTTGADDGSIPYSQQYVKQLQKELLKNGDVLRLYTDHTVDIEHKFPDPKVMDEGKYKKVEERIQRWGGVPEVLLTGIGEGFAQGTFGIRRFVADGKFARENIGDMMEDFFLHPSIARILAIPADSDVSAAWDEQNLKDPKQILDEATAALEHGALDVESFDELLGLKFPIILARMQAQQKHKEILKPLFEPNQGILTDAGRPSGGKPQPAPSKRPRPSTSKGDDDEHET